MTVKATSRSAYYEHVISGKAHTQNEIILECLRNSAVPLNRRLIAELTGLKINAVTARVNALMDDKNGKKQAPIVHAYDGRDSVTGMPCEYIQAAFRTIRLDKEKGQWTFDDFLK